MSVEQWDFGSFHWPWRNAKWRDDRPPPCAVSERDVYLGAWPKAMNLTTDRSSNTRARYPVRIVVRVGPRDNNNNNNNKRTTVARRLTDYQFGAYSSVNNVFFFSTGPLRFVVERPRRAISYYSSISRVPARCGGRPWVIIITPAAIDSHPPNRPGRNRFDEIIMRLSSSSWGWMCVCVCMWWGEGNAAEIKSRKKVFGKIRRSRAPDEYIFRTRPAISRVTIRAGLLPI